MSVSQASESTPRKGSWDSAAPWAGTAEGHQRSLRSKLVLSLAAMCAVFLVIDEAVRRIVIQPAFKDLEHASALRDTNRVMSAIKVESEHLQTIAEQGASRLKPNDIDRITQSTIQETLWREQSWHLEGVQWAAITGSDNSWRWVRLKNVDLPSQESPGGNDGISEAVLDRISAATSTSTDGLICATDRVIHAFATAPIKFDGSSAGIGLGLPERSIEYRIVVGKELDDALIAELRRRTQVTFSIQVYHDRKAGQTIRTWEADQSTLVVEVPLVQSDKQTLANLFVQVPRDVVQQAAHTTSLARNVFVCGAAAALVLMLLQLQRIVVGPLTRIREYTERIAENGLDAAPLEVTGNDEIGALANAFDHMKLRLTDTQNRLADASHAAGMSQVADTVIHNVGNVLTNVNSLIETSVDRVNGLRITPLDKLATRLRQDKNREALFEATPDYLQRLAAELGNDQVKLSELLATLNDNVQHIHSIIRDQRRHTVKSLDKKRLMMRGIVDEAIGCCQAKLSQDQIQVQFSSGDDYEVFSDRSLLLQIIINLIGNAGNAMSENACVNPLLEIELAGNAAYVRLYVRDHGCGMTAETIAKVFDAHFTTRESGTGLGLHFCAITLKRLGGTISAQSEGLGKGSTFSVEFPLMQPESHRKTDRQSDASISFPTITTNAHFDNAITQSNT
ncbi:sensor histidine kinase [Planctomycetes bacterium K23_9]|uniref:histidine kinase n=1 Tax=Stieleria marina TaxID=1930275 RepID=A0A517P2G4_9BACT|nr:Sensor protein ZraS [Planctomycetes bacterium K23_9]